MHKINLAEKLELFTETWSPKVIAELNRQQVKLARIKGEFVWHKHDNEDELFYVVDGSFRMEFRDKTVELQKGDMIVVPRGTDHRPVAEREACIMLFEPAATLNTGDAGGVLTKEILDRI